MVAGALLVVAALRLEQRDMLRVGVLLVAVPLVALALTTRARSSLTLRQRSRSLTITAGQRGAVGLTVHCTTSPRGVRLWLEDAVPFVLGAAPRLPVPPLEPGQSLDLRYSVSSDVRGSYRVGPAVLRIGDPLGLCDVRRALGGRTVVDVLPPVHPLPAADLGRRGGTGGTSARSTATSSEADDVALRQYRPGDDLRRVHWRSTARRGEVMVRSDERGGEEDVILLVDRRAGAHAGRGIASSLEWTVTAAASIGTHLLRRGHPVRLLHGGSPERSWHPSLPVEAQVQGLLHELAALAPGPDDDLRQSVRGLGRSAPGMLVALLGAVDEEDVLPLLAARDRSTSALAVVQRTRLWVRTAAPADEAAAQRAELLLAGAGWSTTAAGPGDDIDRVWAQLARAAAVGRTR
ncbi:DUF58 domain-containing protein [Kineococcus glutinatus]|uniref:DUF58 domain-containing protein n=1 Tax=Kineococcus glutinatus TaxID=1070872 RepID=A0ABP9H7K1_9ACTN